MYIGLTYFFCPVFAAAESPARNDLFFYQLFDNKAHLCANRLNSRIKSSLKSSMKSVGECWFHLQCLCCKTMDYRLFVTGSFIHRSKLAARSASSHQLAPPFIRGSSSWRCTSGTFLFSFFPLWDLRSIHESKRTITLLLYMWIIPIFYSYILTLEYNKDFDTNRIDLQNEINNYQYDFLILLNIFIP